MNFEGTGISFKITTLSTSVNVAVYGLSNHSLASFFVSASNIEAIRKACDTLLKTGKVSIKIGKDNLALVRKDNLVFCTIEPKIISAEISLLIWQGMMIFIEDYLALYPE